MKILVTSYTFDASARTITLPGYTTVNLERILLITNVTSNIIIYNFASSTKGGAVAGNTINLDYDTSSMADADKLMIYYDDGDAAQAIDFVGAIAGENWSADRLSVEKFYRPLVLAASGTTTIQNIPGFLHRIVATGGPTGTIDVYDGLTAVNLIASYDGTNRFNDEYNCAIANGITVVAQAATKLTFIGR